MSGMSLKEMIGGRPMVNTVQMVFGCNMVFALNRRVQKVVLVPDGERMEVLPGILEMTLDISQQVLKSYRRLVRI